MVLVYIHMLFYDNDDVKYIEKIETLSQLFGLMLNIRKINVRCKDLMCFCSRMVKVVKKFE